MTRFSAPLLLATFFMGCVYVVFLGARNTDGVVGPNGVSFAQSRLSTIVAKERTLFLAANNKRAMNEKELTRKIQDLVADFESYLADNPKDLTALILYGKFLRRVDQPGPATGVFLKADKLDPDIAVIKQQIANYLTEEGRIAEALPYLLRAVELSPDKAIYHDQLGSFLFLFNKSCFFVRLCVSVERFRVFVRTFLRRVEKKEVTMFFYPNHPKETISFCPTAKKTLSPFTQPPKGN